ncbi:MAG: SpoIIE family protein phosphatase [Verrucomicrobiae bacterium]|nr:SpoIIE family protein phosphatase [Verrucomicrobiae bacterium]
MNPARAIPLLLVEDNPMYAEILQRLLPTLNPSLHFDVHWVDTAEKVIPELHRRAYELMLLDYKLPGADGLEVLAQVRRLAPERQPAVIMLTGMGNEAVAVEAMKAGAKDYLPKDQLDVPSLLRAITSALERKDLEAQVRRYTEELRLKNEQMQADLRIASEIQQALLPSEFPVIPPDTPPDQRAIQFVTRYQPTGLVGGDFFDVLPVGPRAVGVFLCDVMGHGVRAAFVTAILRALLDEYQHLAPHPDQLLVTINRRLLTLLRQTRMPMFASAFYLVADLGSGTLRFANAGHPAPLHIQRRTDQLALLGAPTYKAGPALGVFEDSQYSSHQQPIQADDLIVLYTDGLYEVEGPNDELFGPDRLIQTFRQHRTRPANELFDHVLRTLQQFGGTDGFSDDVCLVGLEIRRLLPA